MATRLRKIHVQAFTDKSGSDIAQVVVSAPTIKFYKHGAVVSGTYSVNGPNITVGVRDAGRLQVGDTLEAWRFSASTGVWTKQSGDCTVDTVTSRTSLILDKGAVTTSLVAGDRLLPTTNRPTIYAESTGTTAIASSPSPVAGTNGLVEAYSTEAMVDVIATGGTPTIADTFIPDVLAGYDEARPYVDVRDYGNDLVAATAALPAVGGVIHIPANTTVTLSAEYDCGTKAVWLMGDGAAAGSKIQANTADPNFHLMDLSVGIKITDLEIDMRATVFDNYDAIRISGGPVNGLDVQNIQMYGVYIHHVPRTALRLTNVYDSRFEKVLVTNAYGDAFLIQKATGSTDPVDAALGGLENNNNLTFIDCRAANCYRRAMVITYSYRTTLIGNIWEAIGGASAHGGDDGTWGTASNDGLCYFANCVDLNLIACKSEASNTHPNRATQFWYFESCAGGTVNGCVIEIVGGDADPQLAPVRLMLFQSCGDMLVAGNRCIGGTTNGIVNASDSPRMVFMQPNYGTATDRMGQSAPTSIVIGGLGVGIPRFTNDTARDHAVTGALVGTVARTLIWVDTATSPTSKFQIWNGTAWIGVGEQDGTPIA